MVSLLLDSGFSMRTYVEKKKCYKVVHPSIIFAVDPISRNLLSLMLIGNIYVIFRYTFSIVSIDIRYSAQVYYVS